MFHRHRNTVLFGMAAAFVCMQSDLGAQISQRLYSLGVEAYYASKLPRAEKLLSSCLRSGSKDPRPYFFRGLVRVKLGRTADAKADFTKGAEIEAVIGNRELVSAALSRIQGPIRKQIEHIRLTTRPPRPKAAEPNPVPITKVTTARKPAPKAKTPTPPVVAKTPPETTVTPTVTPKVTPKASSASPSAIDFSLLSPNADMFVVVRVAELWKSPLAQHFVNLDEAKMGLAAMQQFVGLTPTQIDSVIITSVDMADHVIKSGIVPGLGDPNGPDPDAPPIPALPEEFSAVVRLNVDYTGDQVKQLGMEADHNGIPYYLVKPDPDGLPVAVFFADDRTVVVGSPKAITATIDRTASPARTDLNFIDATSHVVVAFAPTKLDELRRLIPSGAPTDPAEAMAMAVAREAKALAIGLKVTDGVSLKVQLALETESRANSLVQFLTPMIQLGKTAFGGLKAGLPPEVATLGDTVIDSITPKATGSVFEVSVTVPPNVKDVLGMLPQLLGVNQQATEPQP